MPPKLVFVLFWSVFIGSILCSISSQPTIVLMDENQSTASHKMQPVAYTTNDNTAKSSSPNIILILTDDQDITMEGMTPMKNTKKLFQGSGTFYENAFVNVPVCCPSRSSLLTGRYQHNTGVLNNSVAGQCSGEEWRSRVEPHSAATYLKGAGYTTFYAGKYLNQYGHKDAGGVEHVPVGWDWWNGLVGNSRYYNYTLSVNGTAEQHGDNYEKDYLTDVIRRKSLDFLRTRAADSAPFFMTLATPAPHAPQTPAPQHASLFADVQAPRTPIFNIRAKNHHRLLDMDPVPLPAETLATMDEAFRDRWRCLVSVDEMVEAVVSQLETQHMLDNTVIIYTSDHGYHVGQFAMTVDKRQLYEFDLRVPLYIRGPGVPSNKTVTAPVSLVDVAPTLLQLAGVNAPQDMDGISLLRTAEYEAPGSQEEDQNRTALLVSYHGEYGIGVEPACAFRGSNVSHCFKEYACKCQDSIDNTYVCLREMTDADDRVVCRFSVGDEFWEVYDLNSDPNQLENLASAWSDEDRAFWRNRLASAEQCSGLSCRSI